MGLDGHCRGGAKGCHNWGRRRRLRNPVGLWFGEKFTGCCLVPGEDKPGLRAGQHIIRVGTEPFSSEALRKAEQGQTRFQISVESPSSTAQNIELAILCLAMPAMFIEFACSLSLCLVSCTATCSWAPRDIWVNSANNSAAHCRK